MAESCLTTFVGLPNGTRARRTQRSQKNLKLAPIWETQGPVKDVTLDVMEGVVVCFKLRRDRISISDI